MKNISNLIYDALEKYGDGIKKPSREEYITQLVNEFKDDPDLLNDVLLKLRKDKIDKIKNR